MVEVTVRAIDGLTIYNDEAMFRSFVRTATKRPSEYARWRLMGIPAGWLLRAGYAPGPVRTRSAATRLP